MLADVSVIVTCYNYGRFLERCLRSLLNQDHTGKFSYEIVVIDDCSSDETVHVANKFSRLASNLKFIRNAQNQGLPHSCNVGINNSVGRYIVRVDADDWVNRNFIFFLKYALDKNRKFQAFCCDYWEVDTFENNLRQVCGIEEEIACGVMYRKEYLEEVGFYDEKFQYREGHDLRRRFLHKYRIGHMPIALYNARKHDSNRSDDQEIKTYDEKLRQVHDKSSCPDEETPSKI